MFEISAHSTNIHRPEGVHTVGNGILRGTFDIKINGRWLNKPYECPIFMNHEKMTREALIADMVCYCIKNAGYYPEYNTFQNPEDYQAFADEFGFHKIENIMYLVIELRRCYNGLHSLTLSKKETQLIQEYEEDSEANLKKVSALIKRRFNVLFDSDYINK